MVTSGIALSAGTAEAGWCGGLLQPRCPPPPPPICANNVDDDRDGAIDLGDPGCSTGTDTYEGDDLARDINGVQSPGPDVVTGENPRLFGFNTQLAAWSDSRVRASQEVALISGAGGEAQRMPVQWYSVEPAPGVMNLDALRAIDQVYYSLTNRGMTLVLSIGSAPTWASDYAKCGWLDWSCRTAAANFEPGRPPRDLAAYASFVSRIAARYPLATIETWNEPNISMSWVARTFPNPWWMAQMQCAAFDAVHKLPGTHRVTSPGMAVVNGTGVPSHAPFLEYMLTMYATMGRRCWDAFSAHVYPGSRVGGDGGDLAIMFRLIRNVRKRYGDTSPIWITETGSSTAGGEGGNHGHTQRKPAEQAAIVREAVNEMMTAPDVQAVLVHTLRDRPDPLYGSNQDDVQYGFGLLLDGDGPQPPPKPSYCHFVAVAGNSYPGC